ncbi:MAG: hypothetical protein K2Z25_25730 [Beijerinckiaceae bacterium]|nr:hypothetical protein [Beijerinckiaceae bacterium]
MINTIETTESHVGRPGFWGWIFNAAWLSDFLPRILTAAIFVPVVLLLLWIGPTLLSNFFVAVLSYPIFGVNLIGVIAAIAIVVVAFQTMAGGGGRQGGGLLWDAGRMALPMIWGVLKILFPIRFVHRNLKELFDKRVVRHLRNDEQRGVPVRYGRLERYDAQSNSAHHAVDFLDQLRGPLPGRNHSVQRASGGRDEVDFRFTGEPNVALFAGQQVTLYGRIDSSGVFQVESGVDMRTGTLITRKLRRSMRNL